MANIITGLVLDVKRFPRPLKSKAVYIFVLTTVTGSWIWNAVVQVRLSSKPEAPSFDLGDGAFFNSAFAVYLCFKFFYEVLQTYIYWLMAEIKGAQADGDIARTTGILRSWESIGSTIAYAVGATHWPNQNQMILGFSLWAFTVPFTLLAVFGNWNVDERSVVKEVDSDAEMQTVVEETRVKE